MAVSRTENRNRKGIGKQTYKFSTSQSISKSATNLYDSISTYEQLGRTDNEQNTTRRKKQNKEKKKKIRRKQTVTKKNEGTNNLLREY